MAQEPADLPAWSLPAGAGERISIGVDWPERVTRDWAFGDATGKGVRVCILDSGIEAGHPQRRRRSKARSPSTAARTTRSSVVDDTEGDLCGHGTACAGIVRSLAPECEPLQRARARAPASRAAARSCSRACAGRSSEGFDVINMSLSTTKRQFAELLHELADKAYFNSTVLVASAHNMPVESYPWRFSSVISVGSHEEPDPMTFFYNPSPPVEFFARGVGVEIAWLGGGTILSTGNSFATPHMSGICALVLSKHPELTPFQLKSVLYLTANNVGGGR